MDADCRDCEHLAVEFGVIGKLRSAVCAYRGNDRHLWWVVKTTAKIRRPVWCPLTLEVSDD